MGAHDAVAVGGDAMDSVTDALDLVLAAGASHQLDSEIPDALRGWLLEVSWDRERLWSLDLETRRLSVADLRWHYGLPWWRHGGHWFQLSPRQVLQSPSSYPEHCERIAAADLGYPLHVIRRRDRWLVMDGIHRLVKADLQDEATVTAHIVTAADLEAALVSP